MLLINAVFDCETFVAADFQTEEVVWFICNCEACLSMLFISTLLYREKFCCCPAGFNSSNRRIFL